MAHVTFIHGIGNKKEKQRLLTGWEFALEDGGLDLGAEGITSSMVYWADVLYPKPVGAAESESAYESLTTSAEEELDWVPDASPEAQEFVARLSGTLGYDVSPPDGRDDYEPDEAAQDGSFERVPLPWFVKRRLMKALLRDVHHYLFNATSKPRNTEYRVRDEIRRRFVDTLQAAQQNEEGPHIVVSHSMGTVIAYDCLKRVPEVPRVDALMTIGSPLGIDEIQDTMQPEWTREDGFPSSRVATGWANVFDRLDVVSAADPEIANDYRRAGTEVVSDVSVTNSGKWRHDISKYLRQEQVVAHLRRQLGV
jgi:hypothetical protein